MVSVPVRRCLYALHFLSGSWVDSHTLENDSTSLGMVKSLRIAIIPTRLGRLCLKGVVRAGKNCVCGNESGSTVACRRVPSWRGCTRSTSMRFTGTCLDESGVSWRWTLRRMSFGSRSRALQHARVQRQPAAVFGLDFAGNVRVEASAVRTEPGCRSEPFQMRQHSLDGHIVRFGEPGVSGERPQHTERLWCRNGRVESGDGADHLAVGESAVLQRETELKIADRIVPRQQTLQCFRGHSSMEAKEVGLLPGPLPG